MPNASRAATLEPESSDALNHIGIKAREAPSWWHADLCEDQEHTRLDENQKTETPGKILAGDAHKTPDKTLSWDTCETPARPLPGPRQGSCRGVVVVPGKGLAEGFVGILGKDLAEDLRLLILI